MVKIVLFEALSGIIDLPKIVLSTIRVWFL
jgi:hypothetical protein